MSSLVGMLRYRHEGYQRDDPWEHCYIYVDLSQWDKDCPLLARLVMFKATNQSNAVEELLGLEKFSYMIRLLSCY